MTVDELARRRNEQLVDKLEYQLKTFRTIVWCQDQNGVSWNELQCMMLKRINTGADGNFKWYLGAVASGDLHTAIMGVDFIDEILNLQDLYSAWGS